MVTNSRLKAYSWVENEINKNQTLIAKESFFESRLQRMSAISCVECGESHSLEFDRKVKELYQALFDKAESNLSDPIFIMKEEKPDPVFAEFVFPMMKTKDDKVFTRICDKFEIMIEGFRSFDDGPQDNYTNEHEVRCAFETRDFSGLTIDDQFIGFNCRKTRLWKAEILKGEFYIWKMIKLNKVICTKELSRLMMFEAFKTCHSKRLWWDLQGIYEMGQEMTVYNAKPENQWVEISNPVKVNLNPIWFSGNGTFEFSVQVGEAIKSATDDPLNFHLRCCIKVSAKLVPIIELDQNPTAGLVGQDWRPFKHDQYKMIFLAHQVDGKDNVTTGKNQIKSNL